MVKTESVVLSEVGFRSEGMSAGEGEAEPTSGVGVEDWDGSSKFPLAIEVSTAADSIAEGAVMRSVEVSEALEAWAVSSADELISDTLEDGASSTKDEETIDGVGNGVEASEHSDGSTEARTVEEARSPGWDDGEGVIDVLDTDEDPAEGDSVGLGTPSTCIDDRPRTADSDGREDPAGGILDVPSVWAVDVDEETAELDIADKEAVMLGVVVSLVLILDPIDSVGWIDSEAGEPPASPSPSTNTIQNLWLGSSTNTKHFCSITPTDLSSAFPRGRRTFHSRSFLEIPPG
jgi:hypothetical protein